MTVKIQLIKNLTLLENFSDSSISLEGLGKTTKRISVKAVGVQAEIQIKNLLTMKQVCQP
jgi:hypothetical protein